MKQRALGRWYSLGDLKLFYVDKAVLKH